jgi:hypothetical protein
MKTRARYFKRKPHPNRLDIFDIVFRLRPRCKYVDEQWERHLEFHQGLILRKYILNPNEYVEISEGDLMLEGL